MSAGVAVTAELDGERSSTYWDRITEELQAYRSSVGAPGYGDIAKRISEAREAQGMSVHAARVPRTTVYDSFRLGRSKVNLPFYREIAKALGASDAEVDEWLRRCRGEEEAPQEVAPPPLAQVLLVMAGCLALNMVGRLVVDGLHLPIYLDMVGTALAAITLGPWRGAAVGATTNLVMAATSGWVSIPFTLVNVAGALVWGYGVKRYGMGRSLPRFFALSVAAAVVCSFIAVPIVIALNGESFKDAHGVVVDLMHKTFPNLWVASSAANLFTSLLDKLVSSFVALVGLSMLPLAFRQGSKVILADPEVRP